MDTLYIELKSPDLNFFLFADHLPATLLNQLKSISDLKENSAHSWGHIESLWGHNKSQNKLTAALFLEHDDVKHTVELYRFANCERISTWNSDRQTDTHTDIRTC